MRKIQKLRLLLGLGLLVATMCFITSCRVIVTDGPGRGYGHGHGYEHEHHHHGGRGG